MVKKLSYWLKRFLIGLFVSVLLIIASYASLGRYYIHYVEQYQQQILAQFTSLTGVPIEVENLTGSWSKLSFILSAKNVHLKGTENQPLWQIETLKLRINLLESIWYQRFQIQRLDVAGVKAQVKELEGGHWQLVGVSRSTNSEQTIDQKQLIDFLMAVERLEFVDSDIHFTHNDQRVDDLHVSELSLRHKEGFRRVKMQAHVDEKESLLLLTESYGDPRDSDFHAKAFLHLDDVEVIKQWPLLQSLNIPVVQAALDTELWIDWQSASVSTIQGRVRAPSIEMSKIDGQKISPFENVAADFLLKRDKRNDWHLWLPTIAVNWNQQQLSLNKITASFRDDAIELAFQQLPLEKIKQSLVMSNLIPKAITEPLVSLSPTGELENVLLRLNTERAGEQGFSGDFNLQASLKGVGLSSWRGSPTVENLQGMLTHDSKGGRLLLAAENFAMGFPTTYDQPLQFQYAAGQIDWKILADSVKVDSGVLALTTDFGHVKAAVNLDLPTKSKAQSPTMHLAVGLQDMDASYRNQLIPSIIRPSLKEWLDTSIEAGQVLEGGFVYNGSLRKADIGYQTSQLYLNVKEGRLRYSPEWPVIEALSAKVYVDDSDVDVWAASAISQQLQLSSSRVRVRPMASGSGSWLNIDSQFTGAAQQALNLVNNHVLKETNTFKEWQLAGDVEAHLNVQLGLAERSDDPDVRVNAKFFNNSLYMPDVNLRFDEVTGQLDYTTEKGIVAKNLQTKLFDKTARVNIEETAAEGVIVDLRSQLAINDIAAWQKIPALHFFSGQSEFIARLTAKAGQGKLHVLSPLTGVEINLPGAMAKTAEEPLAFNLELPIGNNSSLMTIKLGDRADLKIRLQEGELKAGLLVLSPIKNQVLNDGRFVLTGHIDSADLDMVKDIVERYNQFSNLYPSLKEASLPFVIEDLAIRNFSTFGYPWQDLNIDVSREINSWRVQVLAEDIAGRISLPDNAEQALEIELETLKLANEKAPEETSKASMLDGLVLSELIDVDVAIKDLSWQQQSAGPLQFKLRHSSDQLNIENISGEFKGIVLGSEKEPLSLSWLQNSQVGESRLTGKVYIKNLGDVLTRWGYERAVEAKSGMLDINVSWPGYFDQWQLALTEGNANMLIEKGSFPTDSGSTSGTLRIVSVLNLSNLLRRLRLDFTDIYKSGVSFDEIDGEFALRGGRLYLLDYLNIESPSSRFRIYGSTDLHAELLDMDLVATLPIGKNLPWIAAFMGGLPTAAVVYGVSKVFENQFDKFSSAVYRLEGKWSDPKLTLKKVFELKKTGPVNADLIDEINDNKTPEAEQSAEP